jgi:hypothetical protein
MSFRLIKRALGERVQRSVKNKGFCSHRQKIFQSRGSASRRSPD